MFLFCLCFKTISMSIRSHPFKTAQRSLIINYCLNFTSSLLISDISQSFKVVVIKPLLKKPLLDSTVLANFRLISSLSLISKKSWYKSAMWSFAVEWLIWWGSVRFYSSFRVKDPNDRLVGHISVLVLLNLSAAFDPADRSILLQRIE